jgi:hypothetical protein
MFDETYFRTKLNRDVEATGGQPIVEIQLSSGHAHRVRAVIEITPGSITLETYLARGDLAHEKPRFGAPDGDVAARSTFRAVIAYESIAAVIFDPSPVQVRNQPGFVSA